MAPFLFWSHSCKEATFLKGFIVHPTLGCFSAAAGLFWKQLMHHYEGVGFPLKLAEAQSSVDCYLGLRPSYILVLPARPQDDLEYKNLKENHTCENSLD